MPQPDLSIVVYPETAQQKAEAAELAARLSLTLVDKLPDQADVLLYVTARGLQLLQPGKGAPGPVGVDFVSGKVAHRRRFGGGRGQPLARAVGLKQGRTPLVLDMTAGLGRDAFVLASLGCEVEMIERSPVIHALLQDGLNRALMDETTAPIVARMHLHRLDGRELGLDQLRHRPDVVYLDPMYPHRRKSALVKKEMRLFQQIVGEDGDSAELLPAARAIALQRVVVKRPAGAEPLAQFDPAYQVSSPNTRYDVYLASN